LLGILKLKQLVESDSIDTIKLLPIKQYTSYRVPDISELKFHNVNQLKELTTMVQKNNLVFNVNENENILLKTLELNRVDVVESLEHNNLKITKNIDISGITCDTINDKIFNEFLDIENKKYIQRENFLKFQKPEKLSFHSIFYDLQQVEDEINRRREVFFN
jgi:hypothetical protein